ncbi:replication initiation protein, partial [Mycobacterium tuberculosis]|nr:replication initiation protein [Mycobacterium tuberculosis]
GYSGRLFELVTQVRNKKNKETDILPIEIFRKQLGIEPKQYKGMSDFKKYVLDKAVEEINEHSDLLIDYVQKKDGRTIIGFYFNITIKEPKKERSHIEQTTIESINYQSAITL